MDELVEKVARAVVETYYAHTESATEADRVVCPTDMKAAQAALAAIRESHAIVPREPTLEMLANTVDERGVIRVIDFTTPEERSESFLMPLFTWRAMIEAAPTSIQEIDK